MRARNGQEKTQMRLGESCIRFVVAALLMVAHFGKALGKNWNAASEYGSSLA
jgi:hypothetical protein